MTFHRKQFPLRVCYAMTINKSQGQTLSRVGLHLRDDVFCHGQLYVALSRTTSCSNIVCLVKPERIINGVPHVANSVYEPFITAATGRTLPAHSTVFYHPPTWPSASPSSTSHQSQHATSSTSSQGVHAAWSIVDEIGDGACLLRTISRRVFHNPEHHPQVRQPIVSHTFLEMPNTFLCTSQTGSVANRLGSKVRRLGCIILFTSTSTSCLCPQLTLGISRSPLLSEYMTLT